MSAPLLPGSCRTRQGGWMHRVFHLGRSFAALALVMIVGAACVSGGGTGGTDTKSSGGTDCTQPIKIGLLAPFSGIAASVGRNMGEGVNIAMNELNAKGGVLGCRVEIVQRDDEFDAA